MNDTWPHGRMARMRDDLDMQCLCLELVIAAKLPRSWSVQPHELPDAGPFTTSLVASLAPPVHGEGFIATHTHL